MSQFAGRTIRMRNSTEQLAWIVSKMIQNLAWATGYNLVAIPVAAGLLVPLGLDLPMAVGGIAMSASTIIGAANGQLLRRLRLAPLPS